MDNAVEYITFPGMIVFGALLVVMTFKWFNTKNKAIKLLSLLESNIKDDAKTFSARDMVENQLSNISHSNRVAFVHNELQRDLHHAKNDLKNFISKDEHPDNYKKEIHNYALALQKLHYLENKYIYMVPEKQLQLDESHKNVVFFKSKA